MSVYDDIGKYLRDDFCQELKIEKFYIISKNLSSWNTLTKDTENFKDCHQPGVYIYIDTKRNRVIKVGRHLADSLMRALQHIKDDTGKIMGNLDPETTVITLINVRNKDADLHWVAALEVFLEMHFRKKNILDIPSGRIG